MYIIYNLVSVLNLLVLGVIFQFWDGSKAKELIWGNVYEAKVV